MQLQQISSLEWAISKFCSQISNLNLTSGVWTARACSLQWAHSLSRSHRLSQYHSRRFSQCHSLCHRPNQNLRRNPFLSLCRSPRYSPCHILCHSLCHSPQYIPKYNLCHNLCRRPSHSHSPCHRSSLNPFCNLWHSHNHRLRHMLNHNKPHLDDLMMIYLIISGLIWMFVGSES